MPRDTDWAFDQYEQARKAMPRARFPDHSERVADLGDLADRFDVFLLDAFGVMNVGDTPVPGATARVAALQEAGKQVMVLTNGASFPTSTRVDKYRDYGFEFAPVDVISSRDALAAQLAGMPPINWAGMAPQAPLFDGLGVRFDLLADDPETYDRAGGFLLLGSQIWNDSRQALLVDSLRANPHRPVLVGNPDLVAPYEHGFNLQPGLYAHWLARDTGIVPRYTGKPYAGIFDLAKRRIPTGARVLMVGDTLHTDILGGAAAGFSTLLIEDHGLFKGKDISGYIRQSGIRPDFIAPTT